MTAQPDGRRVSAFYELGWRAVRRAPGVAASTAVAVALGAGGQAAMALSAGLLVRGAATPGASLTGFALLGCGGALVKMLTGALATGGEGRLAGEAADAVRRDALRGLLVRGTADAPRAAQVVAIALRALEPALRAGFFGRGRALLQLSAPVAACAWLSPRVAAVAFVSFAAFAIPMSRLRLTLRRREASRLGLLAELELRTSEVVEHVDLFRVHGAGRAALALAAGAAEAASRAQRGVERARVLLSSGNEVLAALAITAAVALAEAGLLGGLSELAVVVPLALLAYRPVRELTDARSAAEEGAEALGVLSPWVAEAATGAAPPRAWQLAPLVLEGVCGVTTRIEPGSLVVITGASGVGKTTLLRALLGLAPQSGMLRYGVENLGSAGVGPAHRPFAWVPQDAPVFAGTALDNLGEEGLARLLALDHPSLSTLGPADPLGPGGRALSGGERALVALARAQATGLPVLLLDEPTASLDADAERRVLDALVALRGTRTVLFVSHRPETLSRADAVVRMSGGDRR